MDNKQPVRKGRGAQVSPPNRFERVQLVLDEEAADEGLLPDGQPPNVRTEYLVDHASSVVTENNSPDVGFRWSVNPYRGCSHGCAYCYARPTHEWLGFSAGLDFESKVMVKLDAPQLLRERLTRNDWQGEPIALSGVTDCYQPAERKLALTRRCLQVALEARQPVQITTKNALVVRDLDLLRPMARQRLVQVAISITTLDGQLARRLEPRTSAPAARLRAINQLAEAGIPTAVIVAPVIPGLTDSQIPEILRQAAGAGAHSAGYILLRLPLTVRPIFLDWLQRQMPEARRRVESRIRATRGGELSDSRFGRRMRGTGPIATQIAQLFETFARRYGLDRKLPLLDSSRFRPPRGKDGQLSLF